MQVSRTLALVLAASAPACADTNGATSHDAGTSASHRDNLPGTYTTCDPPVWRAWLHPANRCLYEWCCVATFIPISYTCDWYGVAGVSCVRVTR